MIKIEVNPAPRFDLSPRLFMQFMEPLGTTDASVEAAWDFLHQRWKPQFIEAVQDLAPGCIRWGGILTSYWKWQEGVGPRESRKPMINYKWGGGETNQVGIHEIMDLCQKVSAEPLLGINFAADGRPEYINTPLGENRAGTPEEAAKLVSYCNDPEHAQRRVNDAERPWKVRLWQIGNETSYPRAGERFTSSENAANYLEFARTMRERDPAIELIGWGDKEENVGQWWATELLEVAGDQVDFVAAHMMRQSPQRSDTILTGLEYHRNRDQAWAELLEIYSAVESKLVGLKEVIKSTGSSAKIAITEGHLSLKPHNKILLLHEWLSGLYHAKVMNLYVRHGDMVEISTLADFCGNRWTVNAVMLGSPQERAYLMPVGSIMRLFRRHIGEHAIQVPATIGPLDLTASRKDNRVFLHVINTDLHRDQKAELSIQGHSVKGGEAFEIAPGNIAAYVDHERAEVFSPKQRKISGMSPLTWTFPAASVTAVELDISDVK
jgi:alpha-L-arabinofuranosidase